MTSRSHHTGDPHGRRPHLSRSPRPKADRSGRIPRSRLRRLRAALREGPWRPMPAPLPSSLDDQPDEEPIEAALQATRDPRDDDLPEYTLYRDTGCHIAPACLSCPLERCIFDQPLLVRAARDQAIRSLARQGWTTNRLALRFGISAAQVRRIRARHRPG